MGARREMRPHLVRAARRQLAIEVVLEIPLHPFARHRQFILLKLSF
jgi:hypothetical protein